MGLSARTLAELEAGARAVAKNEGRDDLSPDYMESIIRTQQRWKQLRQWEKDGILTIEIVSRPISYNPTKFQTTRMVRCDGDTFEDPTADAAGCWPSELLLAQVALAVQAGRSNQRHKHESP